MTELTDVRQELKSVAGLVMDLVDPVRTALIEIDRGRKRQIWMLVLLAIMIGVNMLVLGYNLIESRRLVAAIGNVALEQNLTATQLEKLLQLTAERATVDVKEEIEQIQKLKPLPTHDLLRQIQTSTATTTRVP